MNTYSAGGRTHYLSSIVEWLLILLGTIWFARFAFENGGVVWGSDMLYYLENGLRGIADPFVLNRYTHIYFLRVASLLVGSTLSGMRLISVIAAVLTLLLAYFSARFLTKESSFANGLLAVMLLASLPIIVRFVLVPSVDTTLMLIVLMFIALYVLRTRRPSWGRALIVGMGFLFFLAIRTKEIGLVLIVLVPALGLTGDGDMDWSSLWHNLRYFLAGIAIGVLITIIANLVFLGIPLFGFRPSDISSYVEAWSGIVGSESSSAPTMSQLLVGEGVFMLVLYAAAGLWFGRPLPRATRLIWLFPLVTVGFLLIATTRNNWTIVARGFLSGYAVMGVLASRVFTVQFPIHRTAIRMTLVVAAIAFGFGLFGYLSKGDLPYSAFLEVALAPALMGLALALMFISQSHEHSGWAVFGLLIVAVGISAMLNLGAAVPAIDRYNYRYRFALPLALRNNIDLDQPFDAYVSWGSLERISGAANTREVAGIFNIALDGQTDSTDYQIGNVNEQLLRSMESVRHKYVVINASEWEWMRTAPQDRPAWRERYESFEEPGGLYVLLTLSEE